MGCLNDGMRKRVGKVQSEVVCRTSGGDRGEWRSSKAKRAPGVGEEKLAELTKPKSRLLDSWESLGPKAQRAKNWWMARSLVRTLEGSESAQSRGTMLVAKCQFFTQLYSNGSCDLSQSGFKPHAALAESARLSCLGSLACVDVLDSPPISGESQIACKDPKNVISTAALLNTYD
ncbi:uncharacterized protein BDR25DRAFT_315881 [Lindgomyces ingoldianus]|uniref:Uncharacterized protein n=1 Tax=Lindgomyces ingoldianus TaxID=673940 RepID=A0ACB6QS71_9PLEO|nr:uncharacterized protein BDR25DRAFT_315881 [Lindgomyces ingoldianus]KAF2468950.1 hypothetical protein BDR25DRAFT_315881 [Lindgomyces ingoldianus]